MAENAGKTMKSVDLLGFNKQKLGQEWNGIMKTRELVEEIMGI